MIWLLAYQGVVARSCGLSSPRLPFHRHSAASAWTLGCPVVPFFPFWGGLGSLINPFKQKKAPVFFSLGVLGSLGLVLDEKLGSPLVPFTLFWAIGVPL